MSQVAATHLSEKLHRVEAIDALRGLAALLVLGYHTREMFWVGFSDTFHRYGFHPDFSAAVGYLSQPLSYGFLGVMLFFVLSGYCIHRRGAGVLARDPEAPFNFANFAWRRFWRIYPTYTAALILTALVDWWLFSRTGYRYPLQDNSLGTFFISLVTLQGYFAPFFGSNGVFWTLAMEVHLYLAYPILYYFSRRFGPGRTLLFTLGVSLGYIVLNSIFRFENLLPYRFERGPVFLPYWFIWTMGFYLAEVHAGRAADLGKWAWRGLMVTSLVGGFGLMAFGFAEADIFFAILCGGFLRWSLLPQGRWFWSGPIGLGFASVGVFSYSLYAVHGPLLEVMHACSTPGPGFKFYAIWPAILAAVGVIFCAWIFFRVVEWWSIRPASPAVTPRQPRQPEVVYGQ